MKRMLPSMLYGAPRLDLLAGRLNPAGVDHEGSLTQQARIYHPLERYIPNRDTKPSPNTDH